MEVWTTEPAVQFYSANFLDGKLKGKGSVGYPKQGALCLETEHFPDAVHHPDFPTTILRPGSVYRQETVYKFSAK
jgi:aldose 1-epimerase